MAAWGSRLPGGRRMSQIESGKNSVKKINDALRCEGLPEIDMPPAKAWCSVTEALRWIAFQEVPFVPPFDRLCSSDKIGEGVDPEVWLKRWNFSKAWLLSSAINGRLTIRGKRAIAESGEDIEIIKSDYSTNIVRKIRGNVDDCVLSYCNNYSDYEEISSEELKKAWHNDINTEGILYTDNDAFEFFYKEVKVKFSQLVGEHPAQNGMTLRIEGEPTSAGDVGGTAVHSITSSLPTSITPPYNTRLLVVLDAVRVEIAADPSPAKWPRKLIENSAKAKDPSLNKSEQEAIGTLLLDDSKREKSRINGQKGQQQRRAAKKMLSPHKAFFINQLS